MTIRPYSIYSARRDLPKRSVESDKTMAGRCLVMAGSTGMWGAAVLTAKAASRAGSGFVYLCTPEKRFPSTRFPDLLTIQSPSKINFSIFDSIALGPGVGNPRLLEKWIQKIASLSFKNVVLDAGALRCLAEMKSRPNFPNSWILTPHEGELASLLSVPSREIHRHREFYVRLAQEMFGCIVVLKGHHSLIADENGIWEVRSGNASLAKAGTGDVLTGMIAGLLAQGLSPLKAACLGVFVHGYEADLWLEAGNDMISLTPIDLLAKLPRVFADIRSSARGKERSRHRGSSFRDQQT